MLTLTYLLFIWAMVAAVPNLILGFVIEPTNTTITVQLFLLASQFGALLWGWTRISKDK